MLSSAQLCPLWSTSGPPVDGIGESIRVRRCAPQLEVERGIGVSIRWGDPVGEGRGAVESFVWAQEYHPEDRCDLGVLSTIVPSNRAHSKSMQEPPAETRSDSASNACNAKSHEQTFVDERLLRIESRRADEKLPKSPIEQKGN